MHSLKVIIATAALMSGLAVAIPAQELGQGIQGHERGVVDRTQDDLRRAADFERHKGKEISRYENAQKHLSDFDRELTKGHFDKGRLDDAIGDMKDVMNHNTLDPEARDALQRDLGDFEDHAGRARPALRPPATVAFEMLSQYRGETMKPSTTDQIKGKLHEAKGAAKEKAGQVTNNPNLEAEGQDEKMGGKIQKKVGQIEKVFEK